MGDDGMWVISDNTEILGSTRTLSILFYIEVHLPLVVSSRQQFQIEPLNYFYRIRRMPSLMYSVFSMHVCYAT